MSVPTVGTVTSSAVEARERPERRERQRADAVEDQARDERVFSATQAPNTIDKDNNEAGRTDNAERVVAPSTPTAAKIRGLGDFVDKWV